jgi:hypothetical protein
MIKKKLVEKDVEVTVTEKRIVELFTYKNGDYTRDDLKGILLEEAMYACDDKIEKRARSHRCVTHWQSLSHIMSSDTYSQLYKILDEKMKLIESLDNDVDNE